MKLQFLGSGNSHAHDLGNSSAVFMNDDGPQLVIDYGFTVHRHYQALFSNREQCPAIFITHCHIDHVGGLEMLFYSHIFRWEEVGKITIYVPVTLIPRLHCIVANNNSLAEGGANFWDCFHLVPVSDHFWLNETLRFNVFPVRHHFPGDAFGLSLAGRFVFTGDTRPIPEMMVKFGSSGETIFHDATRHSNPSHSGVEDIEREYTEDQKSRMVFYHLDSQSSIDELRSKGFQVASPGDVFSLA